MPEPTDPADLFTRFLAEEAPVHPLPASEVRRRGDRLRRRHRALTAAAGAAAALLVATPLALATRGAETAGLDPAAPSPTATPAPGDVDWVTGVPADFPLGAGLRGLSEQPEVVPGFAPDPPVRGCQGGAYTAEAPVRAVDAVQLDAPNAPGSEGGVQRGLLLYADDEAAREVLAAQEAALADGCGSADPLVSDLGEGSVVWVQRSGDAGEGELVQLVTVGNAVLATSTTFGGAGDAQVVEQTRELAQSTSALVVSSLCVFAADPCSQPPGAPDADAKTAGDRVPDGFPLTAGYPDDAAAGSGQPGLQELSRAVGPLTLAACGREVALPPGRTDLVRAGWSDRDDLRLRNLAVFARAEDARAYADDVLALHRDCPVDTGATGTAVETAVVASDLGEQAGVVVRSTTGADAAPPQVLHVVRVGRAVLVSLVTGPSVPAGSSPAEAAAQSDTAVREVAAAMEVFAG